MKATEEANVNSGSEDGRNNNEHPWPYLFKMFRFEAREGKTYKFTCLLCKPKKSTCSAFENSPSNLKKHVERIHPAHVSEYISLTKNARKRKADNDGSLNGDSKRRKINQTTLSESFVNGNLVTQTAVNDSILNLVVGGVLPLHIVELPEFIDLISVLQRNRQATTRHLLKQNIVNKAKHLKEKLVAMLKNQTFVATTTDCWSAYGKSYIGVTVHWIDPTDFQRWSACLALRRMRGSHTFEAIAAILEEIHTKYGIHRKIVRTTTDNGANFVKAFSVFAQQSNDRAESDSDDDDNDDDVNVDVVFDVNEALSCSDSPDYHLPRHLRCACHTLNLISTRNADNAEHDAAYRKISRSVFAKCQALWNKYGRSSLAVDTVMQAFKLGLKRPNATRWNSVFLAVERLLHLINKNGEDAFCFVCNKLGVPRLTSVELAFLNEYVVVMKPVVQALNIFQSEKNMFMGYLLPTVVKLREKLVANMVSATSCKPLLKALVDGIDRRFQDLYSDIDVVASAIIHPKFKIHWTDNNLLIDSGIQHLKNLLAASSTENGVVELRSSHSSDAEDDGEEEDSFFNRKKSTVSNDEILMQYLQNQSDDINIMDGSEIMKKIFIQLNTPLPASAAVERLFSCAGLTMSSRRTRMSDRLFEDIVMLKVNKHL